MVASMLHVLLSAGTTSPHDLCLGFPHTPEGRTLKCFSLSFLQPEVFFQPIRFFPLSNDSSVCHKETHLPGHFTTVPPPRFPSFFSVLFHVAVTFLSPSATSTPEYRPTNMPTC